jgi:hypothetical protein
LEKLKSHIEKRLGLKKVYKESHLYAYKLVCKDELGLIKKPNMVSESIHSATRQSIHVQSLIMSAVRGCIGTKSHIGKNGTPPLTNRFLNDELGPI